MHITWLQSSQNKWGDGGKSFFQIVLLIAFITLLMFASVGQVFLSLSLTVAVTAFAGNYCSITDKLNSHSGCSFLKPLTMLFFGQSNMCFCFCTPYCVDTLSSPGTTLVFSGLNTSSTTEHGHSTY